MKLKLHHSGIEQLMQDAGMTENVPRRAPTFRSLWDRADESVEGHNEGQHSWCGATAAVHSGNSVTKAVAKFTVLQIIS